MLKKLLVLVLLFAVLVWGIPKIFEFLHSLPTIVWIVGMYVIFGSILLIAVAFGVMYIISTNAERKQKRELANMEGMIENQRETWRKQSGRSI